MVCAICNGSSLSSGSGLPCATSQNGQRRVQIAPIIIKVAVPPPKHSGRLGQAASSHTVCSFCSRRIDLIRATSSGAVILTRIQSGLRAMVSVGTTLIGMRATFSAPRNLMPFSGGVSGWVVSDIVILQSYNHKNFSIYTAYYNPMYRHAAFFYLANLASHLSSFEFEGYLVILMKKVGSLSHVFGKNQA